MFQAMVESLRTELLKFNISPADKYPDFTINTLFENITEFNIVKESKRRRVYYLRTSDNDFFLKISIISRSKDRIRHKILPWRRWTEWRNLLKLSSIGINAAEPILRGENPRANPPEFFILTKRIVGLPFRGESDKEIEKLGRHVACLHSMGIYFADFHPENLIIDHNLNPHLIDVQEIYFFPWLPRFLRVHNLGKLFFNLTFHGSYMDLMDIFLNQYNKHIKKPVSIKEVETATGRHRRRKISSRSNRCCMNSSEFLIVKGKKFKGFKKREFQWGEDDFFLAIKQGVPLKGKKVVEFKGVCVKRNRRKFFSRDRSLISWKISRKLEIMGIPVPKGLGYLKTPGWSFFLSEFVENGILLNGYLSSISDWREKRNALKKLALFLKKIHDYNIWQRDFKSSNVLCADDEYFMIDLDCVRIQKLSEKKKITNIAQLNASLSTAVTCKDRLRFFYYYSGGEISRQKKRKIFKKIISITLTKNTSIFGLESSMFTINNS